MLHPLDSLLFLWRVSRSFPILIPCAVHMTRANVANAHSAEGYVEYPVQHRPSALERRSELARVSRSRPYHGYRSEGRSRHGYLRYLQTVAYRSLVLGPAVSECTLQLRPKICTIARNATSHASTMRQPVYNLPSRHQHA